MVPGQTYYWEKDGDSSVYGYVKAVSSNSHRMIDAGGIRNVRDLGGLTASYTDDSNVVKSGTVKYEKLFRGERFEKKQNDINTIVSLGVDKEYALVEPDSATWLNDNKLSDVEQRNLVHYDFDYGTTNYAIARQTVTEVMQDIVDGKNVYFHCRIGSDRTGTLAYLLEGLLGVSDEERYEEYELSHLSGHVDRTRYYKQKSSDNAKKFVFMMGYVLTAQDIYNWYMNGTEDETADKALIQNFRDAMISYN
jgi:protein tyrosine/serine phosphatase